MTDRFSAIPPPRRQRIEDTLNAVFTPLALEVLDESAAHAGHAGASAGGESHFRVRLRSHAFAGLSRLARQRAVMAALAPEFAGGLHALALELAAPGE